MSTKENSLTNNCIDSIPNWFKLLFLNRARFSSTSFLPEGIGLRLETVSDGLEILVSRPERAILEVLMIVNTDHKFDDAANLLTSFRTWDGELLLSLLNVCSSYKVRRLLFFLVSFTVYMPLSELLIKWSPRTHFYFHALLFMMFLEERFVLPLKGSNS